MVMDQAARAIIEQLQSALAPMLTFCSAFPGGVVPSPDPTVGSFTYQQGLAV